MIEFLLAVPGRTKKLVDRLTAARAALLDNLDAAVSTRAAANTAVSNANYTAGRAALMDGIIQNSVLSGNGVQTGYATTSLSGSPGEDLWYVDITVSAVVPTRSLILVFPLETQNNPGMTARFTASNVIRISAKVQYNTCRWWLLEFK